MATTRRDVMRGLTISGLAAPAVLVAAVPASAGPEAAASTISHIADLRLQSGVPGQIVALLGYHAPGDGGGGLFAWSAEDGRDDGGLVVAGQGGTWRRLPSDGLSLRHFGAVGDGVTDDTDAVQRAVDSAAAAGLGLEVAAGTYALKVAGTQSNGFDLPAFPYCIRLPSGLRMRGSGTFLVAGPADQAGTALVAHMARDIELSGFRVQGRISGVVTPWLHRCLSISLSLSADCTLDGISLQGMRGGALAFRSSRITIRNCVSERVSPPDERVSSHFGFYACVYSDIIGCTTFGETNDGDLGLFGAAGYQNRICNNRVFRNPSDLLWQVSGSRLGQGIFVDSGQTDALVDGNFVSGYFYGIDVKTLVSDVTVRGNRVEKCYVGIAIRFGEGKDINARIRCIDNRIALNGGGTPQLKPDYHGGVRAIGIFAEAAVVDSLVITGNEISDSQFFFDEIDPSVPPRDNFHVQKSAEIRQGRNFIQTGDGEAAAATSGLTMINQSETFWIGIWLKAVKQTPCHFTLSGNRVELAYSFYTWKHQSSGSALRIDGGGPLISVSLTDNDFSGGSAASVLVDIGNVGSVRVSGNRLRSQSGNSAIAIVDADNVSIVDNQIDAQGSAINIARIQSARIAGNDLTGAEAPVILCNDTDLAGLAGNRFRTAAPRIDLVSFAGGRLSGSDNIAIVLPSTQARFPAALAEGDGNRVLKTLRLSRAGPDLARL